MNRQKSILFIIVLVLIGATAGVLAHAKANQKLGAPGVKTRPLAGSQNLEVLLPADVPGYESKSLPQASVVTNMLPQDTSYGQSLYTASNGFQAIINVVLMGSSRTSIHKPQICLTAQGWNINDAVSHEETIHLEKPFPYDLPIMHLVGSRQAKINDQTVNEQGIYIYWFVDADRLTASHASRMLRTTSDVMLKSELDRWAYVSLFTICAPGQEDAAFGELKKLITASVPEFQLVPKAGNSH